MAQPIILVPLDGSELSESSLPYALELASKAKAKVHLLAVFEGIDFELRSLQTAETVEQIRAECLGFYTSYLEKVRERLKGVDSEVEVVEGHPADAILAAAKRLKPAMAVISTHGRSGLTRAVMGSVADKIVRSNQLPLVLIRPSEEKPVTAYAVRQILVPLDGSRRAEAAVAVAADLAQKHRAAVTLVRVVPFATAQIYAPGYAGPMYVPGIEDIEKGMEDEAQRYLDRVAKRVKGATAVRGVVLRGSAFLAITDFAKESAVDLVVMNTHGRSGLRRFALGSVTDRVIGMEGVPVLVVAGARGD